MTETSMVMRTRTWWEHLLKDEAKLNTWLVRLYNNEKDAEHRFIDFAKRFCDGDMEAWHLFHFIAEQERRHAQIVLSVLNERGVEVYETSSGTGRYWSKVLPCAVDKDTAAGVGALAEQLSLERMRVIIEHPYTPKQLVDMFRQIEPDESLHARALANLAGKHGIKEVIDCHSEGLIALGLKLKPLRVKALVGMGGAEKGTVVNIGDEGKLDSNAIVWDRFPGERWELATDGKFGMREGHHYQIVG